MSLFNAALLGIFTVLRCTHGFFLATCSVHVFSVFATLRLLRRHLPADLARDLSNPEKRSMQAALNENSASGLNLARMTSVKHDSELKSCCPRGCSMASPQCTTTTFQHAESNFKGTSLCRKRRLSCSPLIKLQEHEQNYDKDSCVLNMPLASRTHCPRQHSLPMTKPMHNTSSR